MSDNRNRRFYNNCYSFKRKTTDINEVSRKLGDSVVVDEDRYGKVLGLEILYLPEFMKILAKQRNYV